MRTQAEHYAILRESPASAARALRNTFNLYQSDRGPNKLVRGINIVCCNRKQCYAIPIL